MWGCVVPVPTGAAVLRSPDVVVRPPSAPLRYRRPLRGRLVPWRLGTRADLVAESPCGGPRRFRGTAGRRVGSAGAAGDRGPAGGPGTLPGDRGGTAAWVRGLAGRGALASVASVEGTVGEPAPPPTASHRTHLHIDPDLPAQLRCFPVLDLSGSQPAPASGPDPPSFGGGAACSSGLQFRRSSGCHPPGQDPRSRFQSWHTGPWRWCVRRGSAKSTKNRNGSRT